MKRLFRQLFAASATTALILSVLPLVVPGLPWAPITALPGEFQEILPDFLQTFQAAADLGPMAPHAMTVGVALAPPNSAGADQLIRSMYTPGSPEFGHRLTPSEYRSMFSPSASRYGALEHYYAAQGLTLEPTPDRLMLGLEGPSTAVASAFHTDFHRYVLSDGRTVFGPSAGVHVPSSFGISGVTGFTDAVGPYPLTTGPVLPPSPTASSSSSSSSPAHSSVPGVTCTSGQYVCNHWGQYGMTSLENAGDDGAGTTVAIVDAYDSSTTPSTLTSYVNSFASTNGLANPTVHYLYPYANGSNLNGSSTGWGGETELDLTMVDAMAPGATIAMTFGHDVEFGVYQAVDYLAAYNLTDTISMSWGEADVGWMYEAGPPGTPCQPYYSCNATWDGSYAFLHPVFQEAVAEGITPFAAAGDCGAADSTATVSTDYPSSDPYVVGVGGTVLNGSGATWTGGTAWDGNGSMCSSNTGGGGGGWAPFPQPWWQHGWNIPDKTLRGDPDVAADSWDGTSASTPQWAGIIAVADQMHGSGLGLIGPSLYSIYRSSSYNSSFHDIVVGNNGYPATRGWDACTGLGDPIGSGLLPKLAIYHMPTSTITVTLSASVTSGAAPLTTTLTASVTSGGKTPFQYDFSPGLYLGQWTGTSSSLTYTYTSAGAFAATVEVFDANGNWSQAIPVMINVGGGHSLTVGLTPSTTSTTVGTPVKFVTTVSGGTGPYRLLYQWGDGTYGINGTMSEYHVYYAVGTYCPSVEAFDQGSSPTQGGVGTSSCISVVPAGPQPLTASFSATPTSGAPWLHVNFTSTVYGGSGTGRAYSWSFGDGSALSTAVNPYHTYSRTGTFQVNLTVTDSASNIAHAFGNITVALPPLATTLTATPASGLVPLTVQFGSTPTGGVSPYVASWNFGDGSIGSASPSPSHTYNASGTFPVVLVYRDSAGGWASAYTNISVTNYYSLTAYANASTTSGTVPLSVVFNGSASGGEPGYAWSWNFGDGGTSLVRNPSHTFASAGTFRVQLTVTDLQPKSASTNVTISVSPPPLTASSSANTYSGTAPLSVGFNGSAAGGTPPYSWSWNFGDASSGTSRNPTHVYSSPGSFSAQLTVQDTAGRIASAAALTITVSSVGTVTVSASASSPTTVVGSALTFSATASGGTAPYTWLWNFGDGTTSAQQNPTHTYSATGTYNVVASATDSGGRSGNSAPISISVGAPVPSVRIGGTGSVAVGSVATFWAAASGGAGGYTYTWFFGDASTFQSGNANTTTHTYATACTCKVTVEVTDSANAQATSAPLTVQVTNVGGGGSSNPFLVDGTLTALGWGLLLALLGVILVVTFVALHRRRSRGPPPVSPWSPPPGSAAPYPPASYPPPPGVYSSPPPPPPPPS